MSCPCLSPAYSHIQCCRIIGSSFPPPRLCYNTQQWRSAHSECRQAGFVQSQWHSQLRGHQALKYKEGIKAVVWFTAAVRSPSSSPESSSHVSDLVHTWRAKNSVNSSCEAAYMSSKPTWLEHARSLLILIRIYDYNIKLGEFLDLMMEVCGIR